MSDKRPKILVNSRVSESCDRHRTNDDERRRDDELSMPPLPWRNADTSPDKAKSIATVVAYVAKFIVEYLMDDISKWP